MRIVFVLIILILSGCAVVRSPSLQPFSDVEDWVVRSNMVYEIGNTENYITIPEGFVTDFASVPPGLRAVFPKLGKYLFAAVVHDYLYWNQTCTKKQADEIFYLAMKESGVGIIDRASFYHAVDKFGRSAWAENKQKKSQGYVKVIPASSLNINPQISWDEYSRILKYKGVKDADTTENLKPICSAIQPYT